MATPLQAAGHGEGGGGQRGHCLRVCPAALGHHVAPTGKLLSLPVPSISHFSIILPYSCITPFNTSRSCISSSFTHILPAVRS